ncbi:hypothetical protein TWF730_004961 [Orbilia blumenaviensis]|uniref:F-box domain-containing protein n=1 Tax=Orbilia blumenaviensis TaxID=1796055 RepID=A0AAV9VN13_9PEZI
MSTEPKNLSCIPAEIRILIISYLGPSDLFSLLRTNKSLSSIAYEQLYSRLHFGANTYLKMGAKLEPPQICGRPLNLHIRILPENGWCLLDRIIHRGKVEDEVYTPSSSFPGSELTRTLFIDSFSNSINAVGYEGSMLLRLCSTLAQVIDDGGMPRFADAFFVCPDGGVLGEVVAQNLKPLIDALKRRSKSPNTQVSVGLKLITSSSYRVLQPSHTLVSHINPEVLTHLDLQLSLRNVRKGTHIKEPVNHTGNAIFEARYLLNTLSKTLQLKFLRLGSVLNNRGFNPQYNYVEIEEFGKVLMRLQGAILGLEKLETLVLYGVIFHNSWFVIPPKNVKKLVYIGPFTDVWYRRFAEQPLVGVEDLTIRYFDKDYGCWGNSDGWKLDLRDVRVSGLKRFRFNGYCGHEEWVYRLIQRNEGLEVVRGNVDVEMMEAMGWSIYIKEGDVYWLKRQVDDIDS